MFGRSILCATLALLLTLSAQAQEAPAGFDIDASGQVVWVDIEGNVLGPVETGPVSAPTGVPLASTPYGPLRSR